MPDKLREENNNMIGILRLYSLVDLVWMLYAFSGNWKQIVGACLLWVAFLFTLELVHGHSYREAVNPVLAIAAFFGGLYFYVGGASVDARTYAAFAVVGFIFFSGLYAAKNKKPFGLISPFARGAQNLFLLLGLPTYGGWLLAVFGIIAVRNFVGDMRDYSRDWSEGIETLPMKLGWRWDLWDKAHLLFVIGTTILWWSMCAMPTSEIGFAALMATMVVQAMTYSITPRNAEQPADDQTFI